MFESQFYLFSIICNNSIHLQKSLSTVKYEDEYYTKELYIDKDSDPSNNSEDKFPPFVKPKNMDDFKLVLDYKLSSNDESKDVVISYVVHNRRNLKF